MSPRRREREALPVVAVSDPHVGCSMALMPRGGWMLDSRTPVGLSPMQEILADWWDEAWAWVDQETGGRYDIVLNGDAIEGLHHRATTPWTTNHAIMRACACSIFSGLRERARFLGVIRGTPAHVGESGEHEEAIAQAIKADRPGGKGTWSQYEMYYRMGDHLIHFAHHIGGSWSPFTETSSLLRERTMGYVEAGRWGDTPAAMYVRSHVHYCAGVWHPSRHGITSAVTTPAWQLKTEFGHRINRTQQPQIGLVLIMAGDNGLYAKPWVRHIDRPAEVRP